MEWFIMAQTKHTNMVNPQVLADMISANLPQKIKFSPLAKIDTTLVGQAGDTISFPKFAYVGDADDLTEGVAMDTAVLTATTTSAIIKQAGKAVEITDKAVNSGYGDPIGEAEAQLEMSIASKIDADFVTALNAATNVFDGKTAIISYNQIVDAVDKFEEEDDEVKVLFVHPKQVTQLRKDPQFLASVASNGFMKGVVGEIAGCQVVKSKRVPLSAGAYSNFIVKEGAITLYLKADTNVETGRNILSKSTVLAADAFYVAVLSDESKVVKLLTKSTPAV